MTLLGSVQTTTSVVVMIQPLNDLRLVDVAAVDDGVAAVNGG